MYFPRAHSHIPAEIFDGRRIPYSDSSFDVVMFSDVLHHTSHPGVVLQEARRVSSRYLLIKDHYRNGLAAGPRLRFMDWIGNARYGVALPYNCWSRSEWLANWNAAGLEPEQLVTKIGFD